MGKKFKEKYVWCMFVCECECVYMFFLDKQKVYERIEGRKVRKREKIGKNVKFYGKVIMKDVFQGSKKVFGEF